MFVQSKLKALFTVAVFITFISSCSDNNNNNDTGEELLADIQGMWQLDSEDGDVSYVHVDDRIVSNYDYMGDDFDEGPECYLYTRTEIKTIEGDQVTFIVEDDPQLTVTAKISVKNNILSVSQKLGNIEFTELFNRSNSNSDSFVPFCDDFEI